MTKENKRAIVAVAFLNVFLPFSQSLKDKRSILKSFSEKAEKKFHILVVENENGNNYKNAFLTLTSLSTNKEIAKRILRDSVSFLEENYPVEIVEVTEEVF